MTDTAKGCALYVVILAVLGLVIWLDAKTEPNDSVADDDEMSDTEYISYLQVLMDEDYPLLPQTPREHDAQGETVDEEYNRLTRHVPTAHH